MFGFRPNACFGAVPIDMNHARIAANRAIFDERLGVAGGGVQGDHDFFAAAVTNIAAIIVEQFWRRIMVGFTHRFARKC